MPIGRGTVFSVMVRIGGLLTMVFAGLGLASAETHQGYVVCRETVSQARRAILEIELRHISGLRDLKFDEQGALRFDPEQSTGGSAAARKLLQQAVNGPIAVVIEDASNRSDVAFARIIPGRWKHESGNSAKVFVVLIDFADFDYLIGDEAALRSFNVGWALMHELDHAVEDSTDTTTETGLGECEDHLNQMREELGLPLRLEYFYKPFPLTAKSEFKTQFVRLHFVLSKGPVMSKKNYWLAWDARLVGGLDERVAAFR